MEEMKVIAQRLFWKFYVPILLLCTSWGFSPAQNFKDTKVVMGFVLYCPDNTEKVKLRCLLPQEIPGRQEVREVVYSQEPYRLFQVQENRYAEFWIEKPASIDTLEIQLNLRIYKQDLSTRLQFPQAHTGSVSPKYLRSEQYIEIENPKIRKLARKLKKNRALHTLESIFNFLRTYLEYDGYEGEDIGALKALQSGGGDCTEFADLFIALSRANQIPARFKEGYVLEYVANKSHDWAEVYLEDYGWISMDASPGGNPSYDALENTYVALSSIRNDEQLNGYHYWMYQYWGGAIDVKAYFIEMKDASK